MRNRLGAAVPIAARIAEGSIGKHDECLDIASEVAVPAAGTLKCGFERAGETLGVVIGNLELDERPSEGLARIDVADIHTCDFIIASEMPSMTAPARRLSAMSVPTMAMSHGSRQ